MHEKDILLILEFRIIAGEDKFEEGCSIEVPKPWNISKSSLGEEENLLFTLVISAKENEIEKPVLEK